LRANNIICYGLDYLFFFFLFPFFCASVVEIIICTRPPPSAVGADGARNPFAYVMPYYNILQDNKILRTSHRSREHGSGHGGHRTQLSRYTNQMRWWAKQYEHYELLARQLFHKSPLEVYNILIKYLHFSELYIYSNI